MAFNLLIDSKKNNSIQEPNPLIIDPSLNFFYTFNNSDLSGNVLQNQGISQEYDLTISNGVVNGTFNGSALASTIQTASITLPTIYSIGLWVYFNNATDQIPFGFFNTESYLNGVSMFYRGSTTNFSFNDSSATNPNGLNNIVTTIPIQTWTHIVWINRGTEWLCYKNGVLVTTLTGKVSNSLVVKNFNYIGRGITTQPLNMNGQLDGFFVYQGDLSASQILEIYEKGQKPVQTNFYYTIPIQPYTYTYANNLLSYYFDFSARPPHPYGGNRYKVYSSFISYGTPTNVLRTNQMSYYVIDGLGYVNTRIGRGGNPNFQMKTNNLIKNITLKRSVNFVGASQFNQKWIDLDPMMPMVIENINDTGVLTVEIRLIHNNNLSSNVITWGAQAFDYLIQLLFEPIED